MSDFKNGGGDALHGRQAGHPVHPVFLTRWSPRAFTDEEIPPETLAVLFEAARWAPSGYNAQPWRFIHGRRGSRTFAAIHDLFSERNRVWAGRAAALSLLYSNKVFRPAGADEDHPCSTHSFDAGAAWASLAFQATLLNWRTHAIGGFDHDRAARVFGLPPTAHVETVIAIGRQGDASLLPEKLAAREKPSTRLPLGEIAFEIERIADALS